MSKEHTSLELDTDRKRSELTLRLISAVIALPILGVALYLGFWAVSVVAILVGGAVGLESRQLAFHDTSGWIRKIIAAGTAGAVVGIGVFAAAVDDLGIAAGIEDGTAVAILFVIGIVLIEIAATLRFRTAETVRRNLVLSYGAIVLLAVTILPFIASMEKGREFLTLCIVVVFAADTGAYFVGKLIGKRRIVPNVSPGKTWEGLIGGIVAAVSGNLVHLVNLFIEVWDNRNCGDRHSNCGNRISRRLERIVDQKTCRRQRFRWTDSGSWRNHGSLGRPSS